MQAAGEDTARWRFGEAVLDERTMELHVGGQKVELARKPLELLMFFVRNPGEVLTKEELFEAVWAGRIVSEASLTNAIGRLRTALGDEASQQLIKAVYGYGYRFMGEVQREHGLSHSLPAPEPAVAFRDGDPVPARAGWVLRQRLGAGGGGDAWLGEELTTHDTRVFKFARDHLALSALKREITLSRLMRETLGERPDFVRVLDWNLDDAPFFIAIDHCSEGSLSDWASAHGGMATMPLTQRLELVAQAAEALAAAHSVGVLHKDIKPSNLLLHKNAQGSADGLQIKLADFGSARLLDRTRLTALNIAQLGFTQTVLDGSTGTPLYLAPELLAGSPPTTRSDVYALGVVLYQLVVGDLRRSLAAGWERKIEDPLLIEDITAAAAGDPANRLADAAQLAASLRALPARRSARAQKLAQQQQAEQLKRTLDRSRARRSLWMALAGVAVLGMSISLWQYQGARKAAHESEAVANFLVDDMLGSINPDRSHQAEFTVKAMLDETTKHLDERLQNEPRARAKIGLGLSRVYANMADHQAALPLLRKALADAETAEGPHGELTLEVVESLAFALIEAQQLEQSEAMYRRVLDNASTLGKSHPLVLNARNFLGYVYLEAGRYAESEVELKRALAEVTALENGERIAGVKLNLGILYGELGRFDEATALMQQSVDGMAAIAGQDSAVTNWFRVFQGEALMKAGRWDDALAALESAKAAITAKLGKDHTYVIYAINRIAMVDLYRGDAATALPLLQAVYAERLQLNGPDSPWTADLETLVGQALVQLGRTAEALPHLRHALASYQQGLPPWHPRTLVASANLAQGLYRNGQQAEARQLLTEALPWAEKNLPPKGQRYALFKVAQTELHL